MKNYIHKLSYKNSHVLSTINNMQPIINELNMCGIYPACIDDLFNKNIMKNYKLDIVNI